ncbi:MAG: FAD-dependent monooxygenase [Betaproteobacteria bacterium]|nr:FAD-dependent monooxygenase [Betaproteobacteria bacterium]MDE2123018.1 FAD-dependent monooxygenase [Betaproteobacteria bacterium]MDE2186532.1 FAD-dependent monooxygenase [Betaproteobacteria bacterium]MDE2323197.1 FAD-dependent monooxygenase [Betaproteobacteria bacterium]
MPCPQLNPMAAMTQPSPVRTSHAVAAPLRIAIIGAGPVGLSVALQLHPLGAALQVEVFDAQPDAAAALDDPRVLALSEGSRQLLAAVGAWPGPAATAIRRIHVSQLAPGLAALPRVLLQADESELPALGYTVRYGELLAALQAAALHAGIQVQYGQAVRAMPGADGEPVNLVHQGAAVMSSQDEAGAAIHNPTATPSAPNPADAAPAPSPSAAGASQPAPASTAPPYDLVILAEGGAFHTQPARAMRRDYGQQALVGRVRCDRTHAGLAVERFTPGGPVALLPHGADHALVWCAPPAEAEAIRQLDAVAQIAALQALLPAACGRVTALHIAGGYPLGLNAQWRTRQGRIVQLGNAAQTLHPVAGQGLNLGLRDAATLARALASAATATARTPAGLDTLLRRYDRSRLPDRAMLLGLTDLLARGFTWQAPGAAPLRAASLAALSLLPPLRQQLQHRMVFGWR